MAALACGAVTLDRCGHCGALWLDGGELDVLIERPDALPPQPAPAAAAARMPGRLIACPRCAGSALREVRRGAVAIRQCERCRGVFVSRAALEAILSAARGRDSGWSNLHIDFDGGVDLDLGAAAELPAEVVKAVLNFIGELLEPLG
jgi:Zn-finger nucleic acid-binding protein